MTALKSQLAIGILTVSFALLQCTDTRPKQGLPTLVPTVQAPLTLIERARVYFNGQDTRVFQMVVSLNSLVLTGYPFGLARWDTSADPENPKQLFAAIDHVVNNEDRFSLDGKWNVDWYGSRALAVVDHYAVMSGAFGSSVIDYDSGKEVHRLPTPNGESIAKDSHFSYRAVLSHPDFGSHPTLYGIGEEGSVAYLSGVPTLTISSEEKLQRPICCVRGGRFFHGNAFIALATRLWMVSLDSKGRFETSKFFEQLQVPNVEATKEFLYLQHEENPAFPTQLPSGIYVFNPEGSNVAYLEARPIAFAVSPDNKYLYANLDNRSVTILLINWAAQ